MTKSIQIYAHQIEIRNILCYFVGITGTLANQ